MWRPPAAPSRGQWSRVANALVAGALVVLVCVPVTATSSDAVGRSWHRGVCTNDRGVTVVLDFRSLDRRSLVRCVTGRVGAGFTGLDALKAADIRIRGVDGWGQSFVCRLQGRPTAREDVRPGPGTYREQCNRIPPMSAYWSYHYARDGGRWQYSTVGLTGRDVIPGGFEGWSFHVGSGEAKPPRRSPDRPGREGHVAVSVTKGWTLRGHRVGVAVSGLTADSTATLRIDDVLLAEGLRPDASGTVLRTVTVPRSTVPGRHRLVADSSDARPASAPLHVTTPTALDVTPARRRVVAGHDVRVRVSGLEPHEPYTLRAGGLTWSTDDAVSDRRGEALVTVAAPPRWRGAVDVRAFGSAPARRGTARVTVVRPAGTDPTNPTDPTEQTDPAARRAASWLIGELRAGQLPGPVGGTDWGLTIDALWALHAAGVGNASGERIVRALGQGADDFLGPTAYGDPRARIAGATAKLLVTAVVAGREPARIGGYDLRAELLGLMQGRHDTRPGRFSDRRTGFDSSNTVSQSLGVIGLARTGGVPAAAVTYLRQQQCPAGWFRMYADDGRTCADGLGGGSSPDVDGTSMAVQALMVARAAGSPGLDRPATRALGWLADQQARDGSFGGGAFTGAANANSTGLAGQALAAGGRHAAAARASRWLGSVQLDRPEVASTPAAGEQGAVAYDVSALRAALAGGIESGRRDQWRRATAQAVLGLAGVPFLDLGELVLDDDPIAPEPPSSPSGSDPTPSADPEGTGDSGGPGGSAAGPVPAPAPVPAPTAATESATAAATPPSWRGVGGRAARALAGYLFAQLVDNNHVEVRQHGRTYIDHAATVDVALALHQLGAGADLPSRLGDFVLTPAAIQAYVRGEPYDRPAAFYADAAADLVLLGALQRREVDAVGDRLVALTADLAGSLDAAGWATSVGRLAGADRIVSTQAATVLALTAAEAGAGAGRAATALVSAQCDDGSFPVRADSGGCAVGDVGTTGLVVQALAAVAAGGTAGRRGEVSLPRATAVQSAVEVLRATRADDGLWHAGGGDTDIVASGAADAGLRSVGAGATVSTTSMVRLQAADGGFSGPGRPGPPGRRSDLATSIAAAPTVAATSLLTMPGSALAAGVAAGTAPTPATDRSAAPPRAAVTQSVVADAGVVSSSQLPVLGGLLVLALVVTGSVVVGRRAGRRPGLSA